MLTVTHTIAPSSTLTAARTQINATGHFTATIDPLVTVVGGSTTALVSDLQPKIQDVSGVANCVKIILVPLNTILAPSGFGPSGSDACSFGPNGTEFVFKKNQGFTDDEEGFKAWVKQVWKFKLSATDTRTQNAISYSVPPSPSLGGWFFSVSPQPPGGTLYGFSSGWETTAQDTPSTITFPNAVSTVTDAYTNSNSEVIVNGCLGPGGSGPGRCGDIYPNCSCGADEFFLTCNGYDTTTNSSSSTDLNAYPSQSYPAVSTASGTFQINFNQ